MENKMSDIGIIGSGAMGAGIAYVAAHAGHPVFVYDNNEQQLQLAKNNLQVSLEKQIEKQKISKEKAQNITNLFSFETTLNKFNNCELIIEAIVENMEVKKEIFSQLDAITTSTCILASNTSSLSIASIASACKIKERVVGIHFFNPAQIMPLVEIIPAITTAKETVVASKKIIDSWGKISVIAKDTPGFIVNRVARSYYGESIRMYEEGLANFETIDWALKELGGFKMGPFELMDFIGNDINYKVTETVWEQFFYEPRFKPSLTQKRLYEAKLFGRKSGKGYYDYSSTNVPLNVYKDNALGKKIFDRVIAMLINEAVDSLYWNLATKEDIDLAMVKGVNYPKGLLKWCDELGATNILQELNRLRSLYGEERYRPSILLKQMSEANKKFYD